MNKTHLTLAVLIAGVLVAAGCTRFTESTPEDLQEPDVTNTSEVLDVPETYEDLSVSLGEEFTLHENQSAKIESEGYEVTITSFANSPCPEDVVCVWEGVGIAFEYTYDGEMKKGMNLTRAFGYETTIVDSDYETFAIVSITKE